MIPPLKVIANAFSADFHLCGPSCLTSPAAIERTGHEAKAFSGQLVRSGTSPLEGASIGSRPHAVAEAARIACPGADALVAAPYPMHFGWLALVRRHW